MCWVMPPFSCAGHVDADDAVQERGLAVVDVAEEGDDRRPRLQRSAGSSVWSEASSTLSSRETSRRNSTSTPNSTASSSAVSASTLAAMLLTMPRASSLPRMALAGTPMAFGEDPDGAGQRRRRLCPCAARRCWRRCGGCGCVAGARRQWRSCPRLRRRRGACRATRFRFNCRCSRPPSVLAGSSFSSSRGGAAPRRGRSRPPAGVSAGGKGAFPSPGVGFRGPARLAAASSLAFFSSCLRRCSESGLLPLRVARMASAGSLMSGFCGGRFLGFRLRRRLDGGGDGGQLHGRPGTFLFRRLGRRPIFGRLLLRHGGFLRLARRGQAPFPTACPPGQGSPRGGRPGPGRTARPLRRRPRARTAALGPPAAARRP